MVKAIRQKPLEEDTPTVSATGLMHIHGRDGVGKTTLALTATKETDKICLLDGDSAKSKQLAKDMKLSKYHNLKKLKFSAGLTDEVAYHEMVLKLVDDMDDNAYDLLVFDNGAEFFKGGHSYVAINHPKFRKVWRGDAPIIGGIEYQELRYSHYTDFYTKLQEKAKLVIIITHEKNKNIGGVKTDMTEPIGDPSLRTAAGIVIRLIENTRSDVPGPVGLVIKNAGTIKDGKAVWYFPKRIAPCDWDKINTYFAKPMHNRTLVESEIPDEFERHLIAGTLNPEQAEMLKWQQSMMALQVDESMSSAVLEIAAQNKDMNPVYLLHEIVNVLKDEYPDLTTKQVQEILDKSLED